MSTLPKKNDLVRAGRSLLLRHGIRKLRVEEVCTDAGVSKRTFYKYFRNKSELATVVLGGLFDESRARLEAVLSADCTIEEKVRKIMKVKTKLAAETSATFYREVLDDSTELGRYALREQRKWDQRVRRFYVDAQAGGQIRGDIDIDVLMALLVRTRDLVKDPEFLGLAPDLAHLAETVMTVFFYGVVPRTTTARRGTSSARKSKRRKP